MDQSSGNNSLRPTSGLNAPHSAPTEAPIAVTRLAPSPTGALHLGNARTFLVNWLLARQRNWRIVLRIEDLDGPRNKPNADRDAIDTLTWLGLDWDDGPIYQAHDLAPYANAMRSLAERGLAYPCHLTRSQIDAAASAPQEGDASHELRFPIHLRPAELGPRAFDAASGASWRLLTPDITVNFVDQFAGPQRIRPIDSTGDFVIWTARAEPAYQLAVVVDDHRQHVTHIVRADDLLDSAARQTLLYEALGLSPRPTYFHLPLIRGHDGRRLAKRHGDTRIARYRARGITAQRLIGLLAFWCGQIPAPADHSLAELLATFDLARMPREPVVFTPENDAWLLGNS